MRPNRDWTGEIDSARTPNVPLSKRAHRSTHTDPTFDPARLMNIPTNIDLKKDRGLTIEWSDGASSYYSIAYLRRMSPSAEQRELRKQMETNPLTVLPSRAAAAGSGIAAVDAELVGNYALRIEFSDGHRTGLYTWDYLRRIDPAAQPGTIEDADDRRNSTQSRA